MKKLLSALLAAAFSLSILSGCTPETPPLDAPAVQITPTANPSIDSALNSFSLQLLQAVRAEQMEQTGVLLSPLSVALALSMTANGADGDTLSEFETLFGGADLAALNAACARLTADYQSLGGSTKSSIANSLWADPDGQISDEFVGTCKGIFHAEVFQTELSDPSIVPLLNNWVSDKTQEMIPSIIDQPFSPAAAALLVNAFYLENRFKHEFDANSTFLRPFYHADATREDKDFMHESATYPYIKGSGVQGVILPYDDGRLGFAALLPDEGLDNWLSSLSGTDLSDLFLSAQDTLFETLALPKFEFEWNGSLAKLLSNLGLETAFTERAANFSRLGDHPDGYYISDVIHATKIEVKEEGTKAAAVTAVIMDCAEAMPPEDAVTLILDRPFLYAIVDLQTGLPLFLGTFE